MGYVLLQGGSEFGGEMRASDLRAIDLAGGMDAPICIIPTAAVPDGNHFRAGENGLKWFLSLGAQRVSVVGLVDSEAADDPAIAARLQKSKLLYMLGGFPVYLAGVLKESRSWKAMLEAFDRGAVLSGSSAGAMVLCEYLYDPRRQVVVPGLGILSGSCILPHHNTFGRQWASRIRLNLPQVRLIGIDEETGMINDGYDGRWNVYGRGVVTLYGMNLMTSHTAGTPFRVKTQVRMI